ncbi:MAG: hypothetical protein E7019_04940 [Alphaproteobacteria bacterium]|nr:hypothetical protein [Alphaproteobacteria bacterium]
MEPTEKFNDGVKTNGDFWYVDNYVLLKDYYDRTISRIAARCVRKGNIAIEEYPFYGYILDVLTEISETGDYILSHPNLFQYVEKKVAGGINSLKKNLNEFKAELKNNSSPEMIKQDKDELKKMKEALGPIKKSEDPTSGAGMSMDQVIDKLMKQETSAQQTPRVPKPQTSPQGSNTNNGNM